MSEETQLPGGWQKAKILSGIIASILIPAAIAVSGHFVNSAIKENETRLKYVEIAVGILKTKPTPESEMVRQWAVNILAEFSPVTLSSDAQIELAQTQLALESERVRIEDEIRRLKRLKGLIEKKMEEEDNDAELKKLADEYIQLEQDINEAIRKFDERIRRLRDD